MQYKKRTIKQPNIYLFQENTNTRKNQHWKHQKTLGTMFKVNNKDTRTTSSRSFWWLYLNFEIFQNFFQCYRYKLTGKFFYSRYSIFYRIFLSPLITVEKIEPQMWGISVLLLVNVNIWDQIELRNAAFHFSNSNNNDNLKILTIPMILIIITFLQI